MGARARSSMPPRAHHALPRAVSPRIADFRSWKLPHNEPGSRVLEGHGEIAQPWNGRAGVVQSGFAQERVVGSLVTAHPHAVGMDCKPAPSCDKCAVELLGFRLVKTLEPRGQPPRASVGEDGQVDIDL